MISDSLFFVGNATVLLGYAGFSLLTDPNFIHSGESVPLGYGLSTERLTDPAMEIEDLPPLDAVVLSHYHGDHFDRVAEERLSRAVPILTTPEAAEILERAGFREARGMDTWQSVELRSQEGNGLARLTALPGRHGPDGISFALPDVMGSCVELWRDGRSADGQPDLRLYISGDTLMYEGIHEIEQRMPRFDMALLHLGGTRVMGLTVTMDAEQGLEMMRTLRPERTVPIHYNDYEAFKSPLEDFQRLVAEAGLGDQVHYLSHGDSLPLASMSATLHGERTR
jgi:L-ascorbate metabolism protein UlaG (beta-lactamase superfamily)